MDDNQAATAIAHIRAGVRIRKTTSDMATPTLKDHLAIQSFHINYGASIMLRLLFFRKHSQLNHQRFLVFIRRRFVLAGARDLVYVVCGMVDVCFCGFIGLSGRCLFQRYLAAVMFYCRMMAMQQYSERLSNQSWNEWSGLGLMFFEKAVFVLRGYIQPHTTPEAAYIQPHTTPEAARRWGNIREAVTTVTFI